MSTTAAWRQKCTAELMRCLQIGGSAGAREWDAARRRLVAEALRLFKEAYARVEIADCDLRKAHLKNWRFDFCYIIRADFTDANLSGASFDRAILRECRLVRANLRGTQFIRTAADGKTLGWSVQIDKRSTLAFTGTADGLAGFDWHFRRRAEEDHRIFDIRSANRDWPLKIWLWCIDYGRSATRVGMIVAIFGVIFGTIYLFADRSRPENFVGGPWSALDLYIMSAQRILNSQPDIESKVDWLRLVFVAESAVGFAALALLSAVLIRKLTAFE
ncbi:pentapeptide repeat-containing protein [Phenylobacterium sp.]|uniref:pentapeptide repeat-containing protein n=1 Tax=Phenylobacterium sp. TaxID=1871053 RepID=UPI003BAAD410